MIDPQAVARMAAEYTAAWNSKAAGQRACWEEWDLGDDLKVKASRGWFDAEDYGKQAEGR